MSGRLGLAALSACMFFSSPAWGAQTASQEAPKTAPQVQQVLPSYEGQPVAVVELAGQPELDTTRLRQLIVLKKGDTFSKTKVDESIAALKAGGAAREVEVEIRPEPEGIRVMMILQPAFYFGIYSFPGAERFGHSRLLQVADYPPRGAYSNEDVDHTTQALLQFFRQHGYFQVRLLPELQVDKVHALVNVNFHVTLGRHARFGKVIFKGAPPELEPKLQAAVKSWRARVRSAAVRRGKTYSYPTLQKAVQFLEARLIAADYLGSRVQLGHAEYDPSTNRADVELDVTPGPLVNVRIEGAHVWSWTRRSLLPVYEQSGLDPELIQEGQQNLISHFQSKGYFDVQVSSRTEKAARGQAIVYQVMKGPRHKVKEVHVSGNRTLSDHDLHPVLTLQKAGIVPFLSHGQFSDQMVRESAKNLKKVYQAEGFSGVKIIPEVRKDGGNVVVTFRVEEGPQDIVEVLCLEGNREVSESELAPHGLKSVQGQAYSALRVDQDRTQITAQYLRMGYLNASFRATAKKVEGNPHRLELTYHIVEGPRVMVHSVVTLGARSVKQSLIDQTVRLSTRTPLREDELLTAENRLYTLSVFDWAEIDPRRQITTQNQEDVVVKVHESRENEIRYGFGFEVINRGGNVPGGTVAV
ncbi:MAG TPA: POTRA domain-containing protein, partial [Terriglobales bacterium]